MPKFLSSKQVYLRCIELSDANLNYLSWINNEDATKGLVSGKFPSSLPELEAYIKNVLDSKNVMFAVCDSTNDKHIGNIKLDNFDWIARTCELGILIGDANYRGKGIGTEVCQLTCNYAFHQLNLRKVTLTVFGNNPAAIKVYQKLGFELEGTLKKHVFEAGEYVDKHYMSLFNAK